jgi:putative glutamine amidotransferase
MCAHIGPMNLSVYDMPATFVPQSFVDRVAATGCQPVLLPPLPDLEQSIEALDALLLLPGPDVDPALYAAPRHPETRANADRDRLELALLDAAITAGLPILGICRGLQLINTLRGGTLHQHLPEIVHHDGHSPGDVVFGAQRAHLEPGSRIRAVLGCDTYIAPCHHHQAIDRLGTGLRVTARADDGVVEAVEVEDHPFAVAVQWHAEKAEDDHLFRGLADAARRARHDRLRRDSAEGPGTSGGAGTREGADTSGGPARPSGGFR